MTQVSDDVNQGQPAEFAGTIGIEWPAGDASAGYGVPGWRIAFYDDDGYVNTVSHMNLMVLHAGAQTATWVELTMFAGENGKPVLHLPTGEVPYLLNGEPATATFPFLVTGMRMAGQP